MPDPNNWAPKVSLKICNLEWRPPPKKNHISEKYPYVTKVQFQVMNVNPRGMVNRPGWRKCEKWQMSCLISRNFQNHCQDFFHAFWRTWQATARITQVETGVSLTCPNLLGRETSCHNLFGRWDWNVMTYLTIKSHKVARLGDLGLETCQGQARVCEDRQKVWGVFVYMNEEKLKGPGEDWRLKRDWETETPVWSMDSLSD